jgi:hypothetical protein
LEHHTTYGQNTTFTFKARDEGAYIFYCTYHQPTMTGELIELPPPTVEKATAANTVATKIASKWINISCSKIS